MALRYLGLCVGIFTVLLQGISCSPIEPVDSSSFDGRIVGGRNVTIEQYPYQVALRIVSTLSLLCGGSIVTQRKVVTAAHCV